MFSFLCLARILALESMDTHLWGEKEIATRLGLGHMTCQRPGVYSRSDIKYCRYSPEPDPAMSGHRSIAANAIPGTNGIRLREDTSALRLRIGFLSSEILVYICLYFKTRPGISWTKATHLTMALATGYYTDPQGCVSLHVWIKFWINKIASRFLRFLIGQLTISIGGKHRCLQFRAQWSGYERASWHRIVWHPMVLSFFERVMTFERVEENAAKREKTPYMRRSLLCPKMQNGEKPKGRTPMENAWLFRTVPLGKSKRHTSGMTLTPCSRKTEAKRQSKQKSEAMSEWTYSE